MFPNCAVTPTDDWMELPKRVVEVPSYIISVASGASEMVVPDTVIAGPLAASV